MFLGLLLIIGLIGLMGVSLALTMTVIAVLTVVTGLCGFSGTVDSAKMILSVKSIDSWAPALIGAIMAVGVSVSAGWLPGL